MKNLAAYFILSLFISIANSTHATASPLPVTINFDTLQSGVALAPNQYQQATFFSPSGYYGSTIYTAQDYSYGGSYPNGIVSRFNGCYGSCGRGDLYIDFPIPVNNLSFNVLNSVSNWHMFYVDVYVNGSYFTTYDLNGNGQLYSPHHIGLLSSIPNITAIRIYYASNVDYYGYQHDLYYDDFTFTPSFDVKITNTRVSGYLNDSTQKALLGADTALQANILPSNFTGGTHSWTVTGPNQQVSATSTSSSYTVRWTEPGTYQAQVTYSRNGFTATAAVNINVVIPKLTSYTATQAADRITANDCGGTGFPPPPTAFYVLGCPPSPHGFIYSATAEIPTGPYLTDPSQGGIKVVQLVSSFRKTLSSGRVRCATARSADSNTESGWQLDSSDPYSMSSVQRFSDPNPFSQGYVITAQDTDSPSTPLATPYFMFDNDALFVNDYFETYIVYFTGPQILTPVFQRAIGLQNSPQPVARIKWSWGGQSVYDVYSPYAYRRQFTLVPPRTYVAEAVDAMRTYTGNVEGLVFQQCPNGPPVYNNPIDGARFFVGQQYCDILQRQPDGAWLHWISYLTQCAFDQTCIDTRRVEIARGFYESPEFRAMHPALQNPGAPEYNEEYVRQLYRTLLKREADGSYQAWVNILNQTSNYSGVVYGFLYSTEYKNRFLVPNFQQCF